MAIELAPGEYPGPYVIDIAKTWKAQVGDAFLGKEEAEYLPAAMKVGIRENLAAIRRTLALANLEHDVLLRRGRYTSRETGIVDVYQARGVTYEAAEGLRREKGERVRSEESKAAQFADRQKGGTFLRTASYQENGKYALKDDEDRVILRGDERRCT